MGRQTFFPGMIVDNIEARSPGGGVDVTDPLNLPLENITDNVRSLIDFLNPISMEHVTIVYNMKVSSYSKFAAESKARTFVRIKNPFEPDILEVSSNVVEKKGIAQRNIYSVRVEVEK